MDLELIISFINKIPESLDYKILSWNSREQLKAKEVLIARVGNSVEGYKLMAASYLFQYLDLSIFTDLELIEICKIPLHLIEGSTDEYVNNMVKSYSYHTSIYLKELLMGLLNYGN